MSEAKQIDQSIADFFVAKRARSRLNRAAPAMLVACKDAIQAMHMSSGCPFGVHYAPNVKSCDCNYHDVYWRLCSVIAQAEGTECMSDITEKGAEG